MTTKPFHEIIFEICGNKVIPFDGNNPQDVVLKDDLYRAFMDAYDDLKSNPIISNRPNEVGNKIEPYVITALNKLKNYKASVPRGLPNGYPDILLKEQDGRCTYIECKTYNKDKIKQTFRSFYLSPSKKFKVEYDARHLVVAFEMVEIEDKTYYPEGFKMVDVYNLPCKLKLEWNSDNKSLYELPPLGQYHE